MKFSEIVGEYSNKNQTLMCPFDYARIRLIWKDLGENKLQSQNFYEYNYPREEPYRQSYHTYDIVSNDEVLLRGFDVDWNPTCDHNVYWNGGFWVAKICGECIMNNIKITSQFKFNSEKFFSKDAGYDESGNLVWGKDTSFFEFDKLN